MAFPDCDVHVICQLFTARSATQIAIGCTDRIEFVQILLYTFSSESTNRILVWVSQKKIVLMFGFRALGVMCMSNACRVHVLFMVYACQLWGSVLKYVLLCVAVCIAVCIMEEIKLEIFGSQDLSVFLVVLLGDALITHLKIRLKFQGLP